MVKHYLLLKQHIKTGLKYLCYHRGTLDSCYTYNGSGKYWKSHLRIHGRDMISTVVIAENTIVQKLSLVALFYSKLWNIVQSKEYANLIAEDCNVTCQDLLKMCQLPENRLRAAKKYRETCKYPTVKMIEARERKRQRIQEKRFTSKELQSHNRTSLRQKGKSMRERLNNSNYTDPRTGKSMREIKNDVTWVSPYQGKSMKERINNPNWVNPQCKPFAITSTQGTVEYKNEKEFFTSTHFNSPVFEVLKRNGSHTIKRQKNTKHSYINGETIYFKYI